MLCEQIRNLFNDYLDGDLRPAKKRTVDSHLSQCSQCREEFEKMKHVDACLRREVKFMFEEIPVPEGLLERITDRVDRAGYRTSFFQRLQPFGRYTGIAAALLVFAAAYGLFHQQFGGMPFANLAADRPSRAMVENAGPSGTIGGLSEGAATSLEDSAGPTASAGGEEAEIQDRDVILADSNLTNKPKDTRVGGTANTAAGAPEPIEQTEYSTLMKTGQGAGAAVDTTGALKQASPPGAGIMSGTEVTAEPVAGQGPGSNRETVPQISTRGTQPADQELISELIAVPDSGAQLDYADGSAGSDGVPLWPDYLPAGVKLIKVDRWGAAVRLNYSDGQSDFFIEESPAWENQAAAPGLTVGKALRINNQDALLQNPAPGGGISLTWEQDQHVITINGNLPEPELIKIAESF
ncbi:MAG: zf-HC2 domain-containing protein [Desulfotomaculaceae bacterium]|nr:zf-HC2 domain-containing protein [Desulfotomaculaceae bacterium]